jgi:hypothetical protein
MILRKIMVKIFGRFISNNNFFLWIEVLFWRHYKERSFHGCIVLISLNPIYRKVIMVTYLMKIKFLVTKKFLWRSESNVIVLFRSCKIETSSSNVLCIYIIYFRWTLHLKVKPNSCELHKEFSKRNFTQGCYAAYTIDKEDQATFGNNSLNIFTSNAYVLIFYLIDFSNIYIFTVGIIHLLNWRKQVYIRVLYLNMVVVVIYSCLPGSIE